MTIDQEKLAQLQNDLDNEVFIPTFVNAYNEKAASVGASPIQTQEDLAGALELVQHIEAQRSQQGSPFQKVAQAVTGNASTGVSDNEAQAIVNLAQRIKEINGAGAN